MAQITRITLPNVGSQYAAATAGTSPAWTAMAAGDLFPISSGNGTLIGFRTAGTAITVTLTNVLPAPYGSSFNVTVVLGSTDEQWVFMDNDNVGRFDQGTGANLGFLAVTYTATTAGTRAAVTIP